MENILTSKKKLHFIGIGGIGMSSIASILLSRGFKISGSDVKPNRLTQKLEAAGASVFIGHRASNLPGDTDAVIYSTSIDAKNPEIIKTKKMRIPILHRSDIVAGLVNHVKGIAVTGAHGKTTTTAMSALLLTQAGLDPTAIIGGEVSSLGANWRDGKSDLAVCEADESDGTFLKLKPLYAILTNIDEEHLDYYQSLENIMDANHAFINNIKKGGCLITCHGDPNIRKLINRGLRRKILTYSLTEPADADIYSRNIMMEQFHTSYEVVLNKKPLGSFELNVPGKHNVENSLAVMLLGRELGIDVKIIRKALAEYHGTARRFQVKADIDGIMVVEDYAHHPREIIATVSACRNWPGKRLVGVFQPHRYTRTQALKKEFGKSFLGLDELILTDIYSASEKPIKGVTTKIIYDEALKNGQKNMHLLSKQQILPHLLNNIRSNDIVLILGAGDIGALSDELAEGLRVKRQGLLQRAAV